jgi:hypothetical protein
MAIRGVVNLFSAGVVKHNRRIGFWGPKFDDEIFSKNCNSFSSLFKYSLPK